MSKCYRIGERLYEEDEKCEVNVHLLAALGKFDEPFVPVSISRSYDGYSWAKLPTVDKVHVKLGKEFGSQWLWSEVLVAVESIRITAHTSDGKVFESDVLMAELTPQRAARSWQGADHVYVTRKAREQLASPHIWYHLGGWNEDGDTYDTQEYQFGEELELFWSDIIGPGEYMRAKIVGNLDSIKGEWQTITIDTHKTVVITYKNGTTKTLKSSSAEDGAA